MNANPCGKALLKVAGVDLENECTKLGSLKTGGIVSSGSGKLNCKRVYHVRSSSWNNGDGALVTVVRFFLESVLTPHFAMYLQWRSQPDNLVPLCKFQSIIIINLFTNLLFSQSVSRKYLHSGTISSGWLR